MADTDTTKKHGKKKAATAGPPRRIRHEQKVGGRDYGLDATIQKTKDLRPQQARAPGLQADELTQTQAEALMDAKLDEEMKLANDLLSYETNCEETATIRFRLADMSWEKSKRQFFKANDNKTPDRDRGMYNDRMRALQNGALAYYQKILDQCPRYSDTAKVMFFYGRSLMELEKYKEGSTLFKRIIREYPKSEWVAQAWFMVGEYYFNAANDVKSALAAYNKSTEFPRTPIYGFGLYKQGWCYINMANWDLALRRFLQAIHVSQDSSQPLDNRTRAALRKEALKDYVRAYANVGEARNALNNFRGLANATEVATMLENLGNWYIGQGNHNSVVLTYRALIEHYPDSTRLPIYEGRIVDATSRLGTPKETVREARLLTKYYLDLQARVAADSLTDDQKKTVAHDVGEADEIAENTVRRLALDYHKEARKLRGAAQNKQYQYALELYRQYLEVFPKPKAQADVNYVFYMRFYFAEVLYKTENFQDAGKNYDIVVAMNPHPKDPKEKTLVLAAAEESVRSYDELVQDMDRKKPPEISGTEPKTIPEVAQELIDSCKQYIDLVGTQGDKIVEIRYKMARIYYTYNHFDQAAPAFDDIVVNHPANQVACYAANLALDIYNGQKDFKALREKAHAYVNNEKLACSDDDRARFKRIEEQSSFHMIKSELEDKKRYIQAGNAYMSFYRAYPKSEFADDAVYNAALDYDVGQRLDKANEVRRFLVEKFADSPLVPETMYNIAQSYERIVDFDNAAKYLTLFAERYPKDSRSKDAIHDAAVYRATLQQFAEAEAERENFLKLYPNDKTAHEVAFSMCETKEQDLKGHRREGEKAWQELHDCYFHYVRTAKYANADADMLCHAQFKRGEIMTRLHNKKGAEDQRRLILHYWPAWKSAGPRKVPRCAAAVAELQFRELDEPYKKYKEITIAELNPTRKKTFDASLKAKISNRDRLVQQYREVVAVGNASWALAALYNIGDAYNDSIEKLLSAPIPSNIPGYKLTASDKKMLRDQLRELAKPIEEKAVEAFKLCVDKANELGVYNKWSVRSLDQLHKLRPDAYPLVVEAIASVNLPKPLQVQKNGLVVLDGDDYKPVILKFREPGDQKSAAPPAPAEEAPPAAAPEAEAKPEEPAPKPSPQAPSDGVPEPVEE